MVSLGIQIWGFVTAQFLYDMKSCFDVAFSFSGAN
jgi:hypothetical protein